MSLDDLFDFIIIGYCKSEQKEWWELSKEERLEFWDTYIYRYFSTTNANIFLKEYVYDDGEE